MLESFLCRNYYMLQSTLLIVAHLFQELTRKALIYPAWAELFGAAAAPGLQ